MCITLYNTSHRLAYMHHNHEYVDQALGDRFELVVQPLWGLRANFEYVHNISGNRLELAVPLATYSVEFTFTSLLVSSTAAPLPSSPTAPRVASRLHRSPWPWPEAVPGDLARRNGRQLGDALIGQTDNKT